MHRQDGHAQCVGKVWTVTEQDENRMDASSSSFAVVAVLALGAQCSVLDGGAESQRRSICLPEAQCYY